MHGVPMFGVAEYQGGWGLEFFMSEVRSLGVSRLLILPLAVVCSLVFLASTVAAQPGWVKKAIERSAGLKFHEDASSVVLHHEIEVKVASKGKLQRKVRLVRKILSPSGVWVAGIQETIDPDRKVNGLKGWLIRSSGKVRKLKKKDQFRHAFGGQPGYYDDRHNLAASFNGAEAGDIVAFEYAVEQKGWTSYLTGFTFQTQQPVQFTRFSVTIPKGWETHVDSQHISDITFYRTDQTLEWVGKNMAFRPSEPLMPSWQNLARRIMVAPYDPNDSEKTHFVDWSSVGEWISSIMSESALADAPVREIAQTIAGEAPNVRTKIERIAEYVRDEIRYVAVEIGEGGYVPRRASLTLENRYGDCKDKSTLMRAMLGALDIQSVPALALIDGSVKQELPTAFQFDHCIVALPSEQFGADTSGLGSVRADGWVFFDPTDTRHDLGGVSAGLSGSLALPSTMEGSDLVRIPERKSSQYRRIYRATARLETDGSISADVRVVDYGERATIRRASRKNRSGEEQLDDWREFLRETMPTAVFSEFVSSSDADSVWVSFHVIASGYAVRAGNLLLLRPDLIHAAGSPSLVKPERQYSIWYGKPYRTEVEIEWTLPEGYQVEELPSGISDSCSLGEIMCGIKLEGSALRVSAAFIQTGATMDPSSYERVRKFDRSISAARNVTVALVRK